jgi:hypothetical protein
MDARRSDEPRVQANISLSIAGPQGLAGSAALDAARHLQRERRLRVTTHSAMAARPKP